MGDSGDSGATQHPTLWLPPSYKPQRRDDGKFLTPQERGMRLSTLVFESQEWIHRRVERLVIEDTGECTRYVSLDLTVPNTPRIPRPGGKVLVPIGIMRKGPLHAFSITGPSGDPVPLLGTSDNGALSIDMIGALAREGIKGETAALKRFLGIAERVITAPMKDDTGYHLTATTPKAEDDQTLDDAATNAGIQSADPARRHLLIGLLKQLRNGFLMVTELDAAFARKRSIIKFEYREPLYRHEELTGVREFRIADFAWAASTHFELTPPPLLEVESASLTVEKVYPKTNGTLAVGKGAHTEPATAANVQTKEPSPMMESCGEPRSTLHFFAAAEGRLPSASVKVTLKPRRFGAYTVALVGPAVLFFVLAAGIALRSYRNMPDSNPAPLGTGLPTLMLTAAGLLLTWVARTPEDWTTAKILRAARYVLLAAAALCASVAAFLSVPFPRSPEPGRTLIWCMLLLASLALLIWAWGVHGRHRGPWMLVAFAALGLAVAPPWGAPPDTGCDPRAWIWVVIAIGSVVWIWKADSGCLHPADL